jgi:hypothetical protein
MSSPQASPKSQKNPKKSQNKKSRKEESESEDEGLSAYFESEVTKSQTGGKRRKNLDSTFDQQDEDVDQNQRG